MTAGRWVKRILITLVVLIVLLFAILFTALMLVDTATVKHEIEQRTEAATGRELRIEGALDISVFPWVGFEVGSTQLANAKGFGDRPFAALERVELRVQVLPLLQREVVVDKVILHGLRLNLARNAQGRTNWDDLTAGGADQDSAEPEPEQASQEEAPREEAPQQEASGPGVALRVEGVELQDAALTWRDETSGQAISVRDLNLTTGPLAANEPTPVHLSVEFEPEGGPTVAVDAETTLSFDPAKPSAALDDLRVTVDASGEAIPGGDASAVLEADARVDADAGTASVDPLRLTLLERIQAKGRLGARFGGDTPSFEGRLAVSEFSPRKLADDLDIELPQTGDDQVLRAAALELGFSGTPARVNVESIKGHLDDTRLTGNASVELGQRLAAAFDLDVDAIDVDRYLPAGSGGDTGGSGQPAAAAAAGEDPIASLPLETLRGFDARGRAEVGRVGFHDLDINNVVLQFVLDHGLLTLQRANLAVAGGTLKNSGRFDARTDSPALKLRTNISAIQAEPFLTAFVGSAPITGRLDSALNLDAKGRTLDDWIGGLDGLIQATFSDGAIQGINLAQRIRVASAALTGGETKQATETRKTDFSALRFSGKITDGVLRSDTLDLKSPLLRVRGEGSFNLGKRSMDYTARTKITGSLQGQGGESAQQLRGLEIPVHMQGPWNDPSFDIPIGEALQNRAEQELEEEKKKVEEKAKKAIDKEKKKTEEKAKKELEKELEGLFE